MTTDHDDQTSILEFLGSPAAHQGTRVDRIDTHAAVIFLAGARAYKVKRAVKFDYLDFSTLERRKVFCDLEVRLNRRTAPTLYRNVLPVTRDGDGRLMLGGPGTPVEWVIEMERFEQEALLDRLAAAGRLDLSLAAMLADGIAAFHLQAEHRVDHGGLADMQWVIQGNAAGLTEYGHGFLEASRCRQAGEESTRELTRQGDRLERRRAQGFVRQCHGDLHLGNIVLLNGRPTLFDAVEFNDALSCIDVFYDLSFLLMDMWRRRLHREANLVLNRYVARTEDVDGLCVLPLFLSCRAAVRAKTSATSAAAQTDEAHRTDLQALAQEYLDLSLQLLKPAPAFLVAIGGFSGSGKSTLAAGVAPYLGTVPGAIVLRSDEVRKRLAHVAPLERLRSDAYSQEASERVYHNLARSAMDLVRTGHTVIVDAVFARPEERHALEQVAADAGVGFAGFWLEAPVDTLIGRVEMRRNDPSDADRSVVTSQVAKGAGSVDWRRLDASGPSGALRELVRSHLSTRST